MAVPPAAEAAGVHPDRGFGRNGWVTTSLPGLSIQVFAATVLPDGRVVVAGRAFNDAGRSQALVARYRAGGRLDHTFGSRGIFRTALPAKRGPFVATGIAVQPRTGKLVVGGGYGQDAMLLLRLRGNGTLDRSFGRGRTGMRVTPVGGIAESLAVAPGGKILLGASDADRNGRPMVVARYTRDGRLDQSFGRRGIVRSLFWDPLKASSAAVAALDVRPGGRVTAMGHLDYIGDGGYGTAGVFRLTKRGRPARSFGTAGHVEIRFPPRGGLPPFWFPCAMVVDQWGRIVVTGDGAFNHGDGGIVLSARLHPDGHLDRSYGQFRPGRSVARGISDGGSTTCGAAGTPSGGIVVGVQRWLLALDADGRRDRSFARSGVRAIAQPRGVEIGPVILASSGRLVVAGSAADDMYVARFLVP